MQTYSEQSTQLALDASIAVQVLVNEQCDDMEFLMLRPRELPESALAELRTRWSGRGLRSVGVFGLVGTSPCCAFKEPLEPHQVDALASAFLAYIHVLLHDGFSAHLEAAEIQELRRLASLEDPRPEKFN